MGVAGEEFDRPRLTFVVWDVICTLTVEARLVPVVVAKTSGKRGHQSQKNPGGLHAETTTRERELGIDGAVCWSFIRGGIIHWEGWTTVGRRAQSLARELDAMILTQVTSNGKDEPGEAL